MKTYFTEALATALLFFSSKSSEASLGAGPFESHGMPDTVAIRTILATAIVARHEINPDFTVFFEIQTGIRFSETIGLYERLQAMLWREFSSNPGTTTSSTSWTRVESYKEFALKGAIDMLDNTVENFAAIRIDSRLQLAQAAALFREAFEVAFRISSS